MKHLTLSLLLLTTLSFACHRRTYSQAAAAPTPTPIPSPSREEPEHLFDIYEGDTLLHHGYEISRMEKRIPYEYPDGRQTPTEVSYAVVKRDNKIVAKFDAEIDHPSGYHTEFGRFDLLGEIPLPDILFKYDPTLKKYLPANHVHADSALQGLAAQLTALNDTDNRYFSQRLRILLSYIYAGRQDEGWTFFEAAYQRPDKDELTARVKEVLGDSPLYRYLYPNSIPPKHFQHIDFKNHDFRYGRLANGEYEFEGGGWFSLKNVYYTDLTGDNVAEAIVMLSVVRCGGSCDGGSTLVYVYEAREKGLQTIWEYETGSIAYGCGLKSFAAESKQIVMELFGRCQRPKQETSGRGKFQIEDMTRITFKLNGRRFVRRKIEFISTGVNDTKNYKPAILINSVSVRSN